MQKFECNAVMHQIEEQRISVLPGAPSMYQMMLSNHDLPSYDLSSLRLGVTGAAPVSQQLVYDIWNILSFETVVTAYGMTETTGVVSICRPGDDAETISTTSGCAIDGVEIKCVDPATKQDLPHGTPGEIWVRGYNVMRGYHNMPDATMRTITRDGWLKTGDIGVLNSQGYLTVTDRLKDMYIMNGENVYPAEIEHKLMQCEGVVQVAIIGVPKPPQGEVGVAFIVSDQPEPQCINSVREFCQQHLAGFKVPVKFELLPDLPRNAMGKVVKSELRALALSLIK